MPDGLYIFMSVGADEVGPLGRLPRIMTFLWFGSARHFASFLAALHRPPPQFAEGGEACDQRIIEIALRERERAVICDSLDDGLDAAFGVVRRALAGSVEVDVEFYLEPPDVFFEAFQLLVNRRLAVACDGVSISLLRLTRKLVIADWHVGLSPTEGGTLVCREAGALLNLVYAFQKPGVNEMFFPPERERLKHASSHCLIALGRICYERQKSAHS